MPTVTNVDEAFLNFIKDQPEVTAIAGLRVYGDPDIPPAQRSSENQFILVYPRGSGVRDEESVTGTQLYAVESYGLRPALCEVLDDAVFQSIEGRATFLLKQIRLDTPRQMVQRPDNKWWFALSTYRVMYVTNIVLI